jgi:hypothetical protein
VLSPEFGAGNESRTRDLNLGKVALYQLSYSRVFPCAMRRKEAGILMIFDPVSRKIYEKTRLLPGMLF